MSAIHLCEELALSRLFTITAMAVCLLATGCASPQSRVEAGLTKAGLPRSLAACMAPRMTRELSLVQLRRLQALGGVGQLDMGTVTVRQFLHQVRALKDPEIIGVTTSAALACAI
jgi:hypothetical protein